MLCLNHIPEDIDEANNLYKSMCNFEDILDNLQKKRLVNEATIKGYTYFLNSFNRDIQNIMNNENKEIKIKKV